MVSATKTQEDDETFSLVTIKNQSRGSAVIRHGVLFTPQLETHVDSPAVVRRIGRERVIRCVHSSYLRCGCCRCSG